MSKRIIALLAVVVLTLALATTAWAVSSAPPVSAPASGYGYGCGGGGYAGVCYSLMRDANGSIVSKDVFEANLDAAIANGTVLAADRANIVSMYDYCSVNGIVGMGRGCGAGRGMGRGCGGMR